MAHISHKGCMVAQTNWKTSNSRMSRERIVKENYLKKVSSTEEMCISKWGEDWCYECERSAFRFKILNDMDCFRINCTIYAPHFMSHTVRTEIHLEWARIRSEHDRMGALRCIRCERRACTRIAVGRFQLLRFYHASFVCAIAQLRSNMQRPSICFTSDFDFVRLLAIKQFLVSIGLFSAS